MSAIKILFIYLEVFLIKTFNLVIFFFKKYFFKSNTNSAFSTLELLFTIIILAILASIALPKINFTRTNAISVALQSDIATIASSVQEFALYTEFKHTNANPTWIINYLNLSPQRWVASGNNLVIAKDGGPDSENNCVTISFNSLNALNINFNKQVSTALCRSLTKRYSSNIVIPLNSTF